MVYSYNDEMIRSIIKSLLMSRTLDDTQQTIRCWSHIHCLHQQVHESQRVSYIKKIDNGATRKVYIVVNITCKQTNCIQDIKQKILLDDVMYLIPL